MRIKHRSLIVVFLLNCITLTLYQIYWFFITKTEMNVVNAKQDKVPFFLWFFVPIINIWWFYRFCKAMSIVTKGMLNKWLAFFAPFIISAMVGVVFGLFNNFVIYSPAQLTSSALLSYGISVLLFSLPILYYQSYLNKVSR